MAPGSWALRVSTSEFVRSQTTLLVPFRAHLSKTINPGLKPWAKISSRFAANALPRLRVWLGLRQANHSITRLKKTTFLEKLDSLKSFQHVSLRLDGAGSF